MGLCGPTQLLLMMLFVLFEAIRGPLLMAKISHVMDTALWVAFHRGQESLHAKPLYRDPLALKLAGELGERISARMSSATFMSWMMALRTKAIDGLIEDAVKEGVRLIVNLGAGLDTRPYRLALPEGVRWIEVDFPQMISYKEKLLQAETPTVSLTRVSLDLGDRGKAREFYQSLSREKGPILVITEGVIPYLDRVAVEALAQDLFAIPNIKYWIQDFRHGGYAQGFAKLWLKYKLRRAPMKFKVGHWFDFFARFGWRMRKQRLMSDLSAEFGRSMPTGGSIGLLMAIFPKKKLEAYNRSSGFVMFERG
jgi:methyltransferase (TIGR00027 family)